MLNDYELSAISNLMKALREFQNESSLFVGPITIFQDIDCESGLVVLKMSELQKEDDDDPRWVLEPFSDESISPNKPETSIPTNTNIFEVDKWNVRIRKCFLKNNIHTLEDLLALSVYELTEIKNLGNSSIKIIENKLDEIGFKLKS